MTVVLDAAPLVAVADRRDRRDHLRSAVEAVVREEPGELVVPAPVTAEVDYLLGRAARLGFIEDLAAGRFAVAHLEPDDYRAVANIGREEPTLLVTNDLAAAAGKDLFARLSTVT